MVDKQYRQRIGATDLARRHRRQRAGRRRRNSDAGARGLSLQRKTHAAAEADHRVANRTGMAAACRATNQHWDKLGRSSRDASPRRSTARAYPRRGRRGADSATRQRHSCQAVQPPRRPRPPRRRLERPPTKTGVKTTAKRAPQDPSPDESPRRHLGHCISWPWPRRTVETIYEIGALCARRIARGLELTDCCLRRRRPAASSPSLANGTTPRELCRVHRTGRRRVLNQALMHPPRAVRDGWRPCRRSSPTPCGLTVTRR